jgi:Flp pilus assembly protein TadG
MLTVLLIMMFRIIDLGRALLANNLVSAATSTARTTITVLSSFERSYG